MGLGGVPDLCMCVCVCVEVCMYMCICSKEKSMLCDQHKPS